MDHLPRTANIVRLLPRVTAQTTKLRPALNLTKTTFLPHPLTHQPNFQLPKEVITLNFTPRSISKQHMTCPLQTTSALLLQADISQIEAYYLNEMISRDDEIFEWIMFPVINLLRQLNAGEYTLKKPGLLNRNRCKMSYTKNKGSIAYEMSKVQSG